MYKQKNFDEPGSLMLETMALLKRQQYVQVSYETGLPFYWLRKFANNGFKNPSVNRVQFLFEHLTGERLCPIRKFP